MRPILPFLLLVGCAPDLTEDQWSRLEAMRLDPELRLGGEGDTAEKVALGRDLFYDCELTTPVSYEGSPLGPVGSTGVLSCASCHDPNAGGANPSPTSPGVRAIVPKHSPSVLNAAWRSHFGWKRGHDTLESQLTVPLTGNLHAMGLRHMAPAIRDRHRETWTAAFGPLAEASTVADQQAVQDGITEAISAYLRSLETPSRFDDFLAGRADLDSNELAGAKLFVGKAGCNGCHSGPLLSDGKLHDLGQTQGTDHDKSSLDCSPLTGEDRQKCETERDRAGQYQTPTLRNVGMTGPYMHDASLPSLWDVLVFYNHGGEPSPLGADPQMAPLNLTEDELVNLESFLLTLDSDVVLEPDREVLCPLP